MSIYIMNCCRRFLKKKMVYFTFNKIYIMILIFCLLISVTTARDLFKQEGEDADLQFSYHTPNPAEFEIRVGYKDPFYKNGHVMADRLTPSQQRRLRVNSWYSALDKLMLVHLQFTSVEKTDGGTYICHLIKNGKMIMNSTQIVSLSVDFLPRPANCWVLHQADFEDWDIIQCAAIGGSPPGKLSCFQSDKKSLPDGIDIEVNGTHILQKFWFNNKLPVVCCSHNEINVNSEDCNDFAKLLTNTQQGTGNSVTMETHGQQSQYDRKQTATIETNDQNEAIGSESLLNLYIFPTILVASFIIFLVSFAFVLYWKFFKGGQSIRRYMRVDGQEVDTKNTASFPLQKYETKNDDLNKGTESKKDFPEENKKDTKMGQGKIPKKGDVSVEGKLRNPPITTEHDP